MTAQAECAETVVLPSEFCGQSARLIATQEVAACPVCEEKADSAKVYATGYDYELRTCGNLWRFVECKSCGHVWLNPRPAVSELRTIYPPTYYAYNYDQINVAARKAKEFLDQRKIARILRFCPAPPKSYLDIGCGNGRFLKVLERTGIAQEKLFGLELDEAVVARLRGEGYTGVYCSRVESNTEIAANSLDLVTMFHVIEHVEDPGAVLKHLQGWMKPGGTVALETPNVNSIDARIFRRRYWGGYHIPRHWNLFRAETLAQLMKKNGLELVSVRYQTGHSFWMYSLHHAIRYGGRSRPRLGAIFDPVKSLFGVGTFTAFDLARGAVGWKTSAMLLVGRKA